MRMMRILPVVCATVLVVGLATAEDKKPMASGVHEFELPDSQGNKHSLEALRKKKVRFVVMEWTHPTCPYVVPHYKSGRMQALADKFAKKGVAWLTINSNRGETAEAMEAWRKKNKINAPVLMDPTGKVGRAYGAKVTPHMYVLDLQTNKRIYEGAIDNNPRGNTENPVCYVEKALEEAMAGKPVSEPKTKPYG